MLASSWAIFNYIIAVPVPLTALNLWMMLCIFRGSGYVRPTCVGVGVVPLPPPLPSMGS